MTHMFRAIDIAQAVMIAVLTLMAATPAWAQGPNSTSPAPRPQTPAKVTTSSPPLSSVGSNGCAQQYTGAINGLIDQANVANQVGLDANYVGATAQVTALGAQVAGASAQIATNTEMSAALIEAGVAAAAGLAIVDLPVTAPATGAGLVVAGSAAAENATVDATMAVAIGSAAVGAASSITGVISQQVALNHTKAAQALTEHVANLPNCDSEFTGTVKVSGGGVNVTGASIFNNDVGVAANVNVQGNANASQVHATQGISADGGAIWIGDPNGTTYSSGITIGGGAVSGAGFGGAQAYTGDVNAIAIGNTAQALLSGSLAFGLSSSSTAVDAIAIGTAAAANGTQDVVVGAHNDSGVGGNNTVMGNNISIFGNASANNTVLGVGHQVTGSGNFVGGDPNTIVGNNNVATGVNITVNGDSNIAVGDTVNISGNRAIAVGNNATAKADDTTVIGTNAQANAAGSAAFGQGAVASQPQQQVFGTQANTYTTPGITSALSRTRQTGPLEIATTDAAGNLATDGGQVFDALSADQAGIAVAMALGAPSLRAGDTFGIAMNWGMFERSQALGISAMGVVGSNVFKAGDTFSLTASMGGSIAEQSFGGRSTNHMLGGRVGAQLTW